MLISRARRPSSFSSTPTRAYNPDLNPSPGPGPTPNPTPNPSFSGAPTRAFSCCCHVQVGRPGARRTCIRMHTLPRAGGRPGAPPHSSYHPTSCLLPPTSCLLRPASYVLPPTSYLLPPTGAPPTSYLLPPASYLLPPTSYLLPPTSYRCSSSWLVAAQRQWRAHSWRSQLHVWPLTDRMRLADQLTYQSHPAMSVGPPTDPPTAAGGVGGSRGGAGQRLAHWLTHAAAHGGVALTLTLSLTLSLTLTLTLTHAATHGGAAVESPEAGLLLSPSSYF